MVAAAGRAHLLTAVVRASCTVLIAAPALLAALTERAAADGAEVIAFAEADALRALDAITRRRPDIVALERLFAATPRGAALINRIKADPALGHSQIRVVAQDAEPVSVEPASAPADSALYGLDHRGTRRAPRFVLEAGLEVTIDGAAATLVDLSTVGAQVLSATVLKPNQRVRIAIADGRTTIRTTGSIAWASFEIPSGAGPRYRAGIEFINTDAAAISAFCLAHRR